MIIWFWFIKWSWKYCLQLWSILAIWLVRFVFPFIAQPISRWCRPNSTWSVPIWIWLSFRALWFVFISLLIIAAIDRLSFWGVSSQFRVILVFSLLSWEIACRIVYWTVLDLLMLRVWGWEMGFFISTSSSSISITWSFPSLGSTPRVKYPLFAVLHQKCVSWAFRFKFRADLRTLNSPTTVF